MPTRPTIQRANVSETPQDDVRVWGGTRGVHCLLSPCKAISTAFVGRGPGTDLNQQVRQQRRVLSAGSPRMKDKDRMRSIGGRVLMMKPIRPGKKSV